MFDTFFLEDSLSLSWSNDTLLILILQFYYFTSIKSICGAGRKIANSIVCLSNCLYQKMKLFPKLIKSKEKMSPHQNLVHIKTFIPKFQTENLKLVDYLITLDLLKRISENWDFDFSLTIHLRNLLVFM